MSHFDDDPRLEKVTSREGRAALSFLKDFAQSRKWDMRCGGTAVPHIQFRRHANERPYPHSLILNPVTPTFYVRRPASSERKALLADFDGAHENPSGEIKIPVRDAMVAKKVADRFLT